MRLKPEWQLRPLVSRYMLKSLSTVTGSMILQSRGRTIGNEFFLAELEIKRLTANKAEEDRTLVFNPSNLPTGIETADVLSSFYSEAFRLSAKEERGVASVAGN